MSRFKSLTIIAEVEQADGSTRFVDAHLRERDIEAEVLVYLRQKGTEDLESKAIAAEFEHDALGG